jgi:hypothetical protein
MWEWAAQSVIEKSIQPRFTSFGQFYVLRLFVIAFGLGLYVFSVYILNFQLRFLGIGFKF